MRLCWAQGIIAKEESDKIIEGLKGILADIEAGKIHFSQDYEDIHMNVEQIDRAHRRCRKTSSHGEIQK